MYSSFYTALQADKTHHNLILQAVASDDATMSMLQVPLNVTALVPTDVVSVLHAGLAGPDSTFRNSCTTAIVPDTLQRL